MHKSHDVVLTDAIRRHINDLKVSRPYDGRRVTMHESRGSWHFIGVSGICTHVASDKKHMVLIVENDAEGYWPVGMELLVELDFESVPVFRTTIRGLYEQEHRRASHRDHEEGREGRGARP